MRKILIIDDEKDFCFFIKKNLEATGDFQVDTCCNARDSLGLAESTQPDLILLDILMPEESGTQIAEKLKNNNSTKNIPIVFLTAVITPEELEIKGSFIKGNHVLAKPVRITMLLNIIALLTDPAGDKSR